MQGVIVHARYFLFQLFLYHLLVMELEAHEVQEVPGSPQGPKKN